ncbi:MAG: glycosyltransferase family 2 protein [Ferruginibacter sp.]|nr:glycosyltransferase family 2 protein [Ferruginibacter sp.]
MKDTPLVSIITLNYNQADVTIEFLKSTQNLTYNHFEILVCDMNSIESPADKIQSLNLPNTKVLLSDTNLGFAAGNNWGMRHAKGDYFFIVNNDTEVTPSLLNELLEPFSKDPSIGVTCPKIRFFQNPDILQYAGFTKMKPISGKTHSIGWGEKDTGQYNLSGFTYGAHGCAMMVKREVTERIGMFPEKFFLYYEEWDWSERIRKAGFNIYYQADALIYHKESLSVGKNNPLKVYYLTRNRILFMRRNRPLLSLLVFYFYFTLFTIPKNIFVYLLRGEFDFLKAFLRGIGWNLRNNKKSPV